VVHVPLDVGESEIAAAEAIRERFVVESQLTENGRMQVVDRDGIFDDGHPEVISLPVNKSCFEPAAGDHD